VPQDGPADEGQRAVDGASSRRDSRDNNFTQGKIKRRQSRLKRAWRYMSQLDTADRRIAAGEDPSEAVLLSKTRLKGKADEARKEVNGCRG